MSAFDAAVARVLEHEGGLSDHPSDRGGLTKYGITLGLFRRVRPNGTEADLRTLTIDEARAIYRTAFWDPGHFDRLGAPLVAAHAFDFAVNAGGSTAIKALQAALRLLGAAVDADGVLGPATAAAVNGADAAAVLAAFRVERIRHYAALVGRDRSQAVFLLGWIRRALA